MVLFPLEFSDCLTDSPSFRQKIQEHEKELVRTNQSIKRLIKQLRDMITAARNLAKAQETLASTLLTFKFECIGTKQTDDELIINRSLFEFGSMMSALEKEHSQMLDQAELKFIQDLDEFRKKRFGSVKEGKKNFDRETAKFCTSLEKHLGLPAKKNESTLKEADADIDVQLKNFQKASLDYVLLLQEVQEQKKFEFVEILLGFLYSWISFYHQGYEVYQDYEPYVKQLQAKIQKCRDEFESMKEEGQSLKEKVLEVRKRTRNDPSAKNKDGRDGYLFLLEKSKMAALTLGTTWVKYYCYYKKTTRELRIVCFSQTNSAAKLPTELMHRVESCQRRHSDTIDKRFCFDVKTTDKQTLTFQALSEEDRCLWIDTMDGKEMLYDLVGLPKRQEQENLLNDVGFEFVRSCIDAIEKRGINEQGLYRVVGVVSKVSKLTGLCLDRRNAEKVLKDLSDQNSEWEVRTITSALKSYFKNLPEPLLTFQLHQEFITASKKESKTLRINDIHSLVYTLPESNFEMLDILIRHLNNVASHSQHNLMTVANLGVCFGPTLMRDEEETMASIIDIKFCNVVVEILIEYYDKIFHSKPDGTNILEDVPSKSPRGMRSNPLAPPQICPEPEVKPREEVDDPIPYAQSLRLQLIEANQRKLRPRAIYESEELVEGLSKPPRTEAVVSSSSSSSNDSLSSRSQSSSNPASFVPSSDVRGRDSVRAAVANPFYGVPGEVYRPEDTSRSRHYETRGAPNSNSSGSNSSQQHFPKLGPPMPPMPPDLLARSIAAANSGPHGTALNPAPKRRARALYACTGDNDQELSFECGATIENVRPSREPGWLVGIINGRTGLIPANYVEFLPH